MRSALGALVALALLVAAAPAGAATVRVDPPGTLVYEGAPGEANDVTVAFSSGSWTVTDAGAPLTAGAGCSVAGATATCTGSGSPAVLVRLGDGDDKLSMPASHDGIDIGGGAGNDQITLGPGNGTANLHGDAGADTIHSDAAHATLDYSASPGGVNVFVDGQPNDGGVQERDNDTGTFEAIVGTPFTDELAAGSDGTIVRGGGGTDTLIGGAGNDRFEPGPGDDAVYGAGGDDVALLDGRNAGGFYTGGPGNDTLIVDDSAFGAGPLPFTNILTDGRANDGPPGGRANVQPDWETITVPRGHVIGGTIDETIHVTSGIANGGRGNDRVSGDETLIGGRGRDAFTLDNPPTNVVIAADGEADRIDCSRGVPKSISMDPVDKARGCGPAFALLGSRRVAPDPRGFVTVKLKCTSPLANVPCVAKAYFENGSTVYARGTTAPVAAGRSARVRLRLSSRWKRFVDRGRRLSGQVVVRPARADHALTLPGQLGRIAVR